MLRAMTDDDLEWFGAHVRGVVVADLVTAGYDEPEARKIADEQVAAVLVDGRLPPGHQVCQVVREDDAIGHVWYGPDPGSATGLWWIYELELERTARDAGIEDQVLALVEDDVRQRGGTAIAVRVAAHQDALRHRYQHAGFRAVSTLMRKAL